MSKLYIVGTPIGNLKDITLRAVETLKSADLIACEDTRRTAILLNAFKVKKPLVSYHKFNEKQTAEKLIAEVLSGKNVALVTDAGMPCISDPGAVLINAAREAGAEVEITGGVTAFTHALVASGFDASLFCFAGFLPEKNKDKKSLTDKISGFLGTVIFYCAPHNLRADMEYLLKTLGDRRVAVCRELTKLHEETVITTLSAPPGKEPRGEYVLVVGGAAAKETPLNALEVKEHVRSYMEQGFSKMDAVKAAAKDRGVPKNEIYKEML